MKAYWMGRDVDELNREEAIEAVKMLGRELESTLEACRKIRELNKLIHDRKTACR